jgi:hypothetical protein
MTSAVRLARANAAPAWGGRWATAEGLTDTALEGVWAGGRIGALFADGSLLRVSDGCLDLAGLPVDITSFTVNFRTYVRTTSGLSDRISQILMKEVSSFLLIARSTHARVPGSSTKSH